jgi:ketosteroid isomerase-like protein
MTLLVISCQNKLPAIQETEKERQEILKADQDFSEMSVREGTSKAFLKYAASEAILLRERNYPVIGIKNLVKHMSDPGPKEMALEWEPLRAEIAASGDLGYTFGTWKYTAENGKKVIIRGNYVTIWKKQADGRWKFVLDGGTTYPSGKNKNGYPLA